MACKVEGDVQTLIVTDWNPWALNSYANATAGTLLEKSVHGRVTKYEYDAANQLVAQTTDAGTPQEKRVEFAYDGAGRMTREGQREYRYGGLDKVVAVLEAGRTVAEFAYGADGQLASIERANGEHERLWWRGLALTRRDYLNGKEVVSSERYLNEPHPGGGNPVLAWEGKAAPESAKEQARAAATRLLFNDMLGSTISVIDGDRAEATNMTLFGETPDGQGAGFFTGKPHIDELGYAFLFRNYRPEKAKWQTADPLGYPDGWNALAYCGNGAISKIDNLGLAENWFSDDVRYHAHDPKQVFYYGIINDDGIDTVMGTKVLILWTEKIHAVCQICYGPDCSTEECYKTITLRSIVENVEWVAKKLPMTCPTVPADVVVGLGNIILDRILPTDTYWPIDFSKIDRHYQNRVRNAPAPEIRRDSFLGRHCEE